MKKWTLLFAGVSVIISFWLIASGQEIENPNQLDIPKKSKPVRELQIDLTHLQKEVNDYMLSEYQKHSFAGAAVAIVYKDSLVFLGAFGNRSAEDTSLIDNNSIFRIGSLSKGFNGILSSVLAEKGLISLEEKIKNDVPELSLINKDHEDELKLKHLLSHSGGFPYHSYTNLVEAGATISNISKEFIQITNLTKPGTVYSYQNAAFSISELVLEKHLGEPYDKILHEYIFNPLAMKNSSCSLAELSSSDNVALPQRFSKGTWKTRKPSEKYYNAISAGGINVSITDMSIWLKALLGNYPEVISEKAITTAFTPFIETKARSKYYTRWSNFHNSYYGLGWRIHTMKDNNSMDSLRTIVHHGGQVNGYRSEILIDQKNDYGISVLFSNYSLLAKNIIPDMVEILEACEVKCN